jgi:preprotein translocase subunit YajC
VASVALLVFPVIIMGIMAYFYSRAQQLRHVWKS